MSCAGKSLVNDTLLDCQSDLESLLLPSEDAAKESKDVDAIAADTSPSSSSEPIEIALGTESTFSESSPAYVPSQICMFILLAL